MFSYNLPLENASRRVATRKVFIHISSVRFPKRRVAYLTGESVSQMTMPILNFIVNYTAYNIAFGKAYKAYTNIELEIHRTLIHCTN